MRYEVAVFVGAGLAGNPAAVCPLSRWAGDAALQAVAADSGLPATAFLVADAESYRLRWFSPTRELELCGHGTLAAAHVVLELLAPSRGEVAFDSTAGRLRVSRDGDRLAIDLPAEAPVPCPAPAALVEGLGGRPVEVLWSRDCLAVLEAEADVRALRPDLVALAGVETRGVIVTAPGQDSDFVSRFFAPRLGIPEDPATGSAHATLTPYWARRLGRSRLHARQLSARGGEIFCEARGARVIVAGRVARQREDTIEL